MLMTPSFADLIRTFALIGCLSFGGAAGQIAMMHRMLVDERRWLDEQTYLAALNYCMLLPGPEAQQLATYIGWKTHGIRGGLASGMLFVVPGALLMLALSWLYVFGTGLTLVDGVFFGIKAAVLAIVVHALQKIAARGLKTRVQMVLAALAFAAILLFDIAFPLVVLAAGAVGAVLLAPAATTQAAPEPRRIASAAKAAGLCLVAWWLPVLAAVLVFGPGSILVEIGLFFSKLAVVTFGGAYAVLAYLAQAGVERGWVTAAEMMDGLGLAETTPGPTILVNQFVAFLAGHSQAEGVPPLLLASLAAILATWVTFAPSFLWIFAGAPFLDDIRRQPRLAGALAGITAAVVGVIGFITLWFALHFLFGTVTTALFGPVRLPMVDVGALNLVSAALSVLAVLVMFVWHRGIVTTVAVMAVAGAAVKAAGL